MLRVTSEDNYPARVVPLQLFMGATPKETVDKVVGLKSRATDQIAAGSDQSGCRWFDPGVFGTYALARVSQRRAQTGLWYTAHLNNWPNLYRLALAAGVQVHTHTNGDEATEMVLETLAPALKETPSPNHRFTLQHCQLADAAQFRKMKELNMCVNLFANHHFYWGDEHYRLTVGPERALRMNACRTALETDVPMAIHSDAPVTPLGPFFTAWCAVNRLTASGRTQGEHEKIGGRGGTVCHHIGRSIYASSG